MIHVQYEDWKYLAVQVGELSEYIDDGSWHARYEYHLMERMKMIEPFIPGSAQTYCDIGGGLCGIGVVLNNYYGGNLSVNVIDGNGPPIVVHHALPFNDAGRTKAFLGNNGVHRVRLWNINELPHYHFDLITSFRAWCFHIEPGQYIDWVREHLKPSGILIVDVRTDRPSFIAALKARFGRAQEIGVYGKGTLWQFQL